MNSEEVSKVLVSIPDDKVEQKEAKVKAEFWPKLRKFAARIPFAEDAVAAYFCATDKKTPLKVRGTLLAALAYFILPLDFIPDILVIAGFTDDLTVLTAALALVQTHVTDDHREQAAEAIEEELMADH